MKKDDPCISVCQFDGKTGWCLGCGRTVPEIRVWKKLTPFRMTALVRKLPRRVDQLAKASDGDQADRRGGKDAPRARKIVSVVVAFVLALVSVMPLVFEAGHEAHDGGLTHVAVVVEHIHAADHRDADELIHHAQSHAQGVMPAVAKASAAEAPSAAQSFARADDAYLAGEEVRGPFEPPRA